MNYIAKTINTRNNLNVINEHIFLFLDQVFVQNVKKVINVNWKMTDIDVLNLIRNLMVAELFEVINVKFVMKAITCILTTIYVIKEIKKI